MRTTYNFFFVLLLLGACGKYTPDVVEPAPLDLGNIPTSYASLEENSVLDIPLQFTTPGGVAIDSATYKVVNNRKGKTFIAFSYAVKLTTKGNSIDTTLHVPIRMGTMSIVIMVYYSGKLSAKSIDIGTINPSQTALKTFTDVSMSTDPADNANFFAAYESTPVFGSADAFAKQGRIDMMLVNMNGGRFISPMAWSAGTDYYNASKAAMAGFTKITYAFLTASRAQVTRANFNAITNDAQLNKFINDSIINPKAGNYNVVTADRRISDVFTVSGEKGFILGWGYRNSPNLTPAIAMNQSFALVIMKTVTKKANGHYVITFDMKAPAVDNRASYPESVIAPYNPYPL